MNQTRHQDAVLNFLFGQLQQRSQEVVTEALNAERATFNQWAEESNRIAHAQSDRIAALEMALQELRERNDRGERYTHMLEDAVKLKDMIDPDTNIRVKGACWLNTFGEVFQISEQERDREFAEAIEPQHEGLGKYAPVEPTPEDANHRD